MTLGTILSGFLPLGYLFVAIMIIYGLIDGAKALGESFFDP